MIRYFYRKAETVSFLHYFNHLPLSIVPYEPSVSAGSNMFKLKDNLSMTQGNETLFPNWQKKLWQTFEETSGYVRPERVKQVAQLHDRYKMMMMMI
jgi:hypothetical protein